MMGISQIEQTADIINNQMAIRYLTDHRLAYAMEKSVVGNTAEAAPSSGRIAALIVISVFP